jgi:2-polyprenyl-6-hydroxyphenyl methylase/3-demethylubiquinone-9 3-methyltransferase
MPKPSTFAFGANWTRFLRHVTEDRVHSAGRSLVEFMSLENLHNKTFLDVGCGSGLFSYAAFQLGAERIVSFDADPLSVECCKHLRSKADSPANWEVYQGSILDANFTAQLGTFDVVYAWGTLQHSGRLWEAIRRSTQLVKEGGYLYLAIYNQVDGWLGSGFWRGFKRVFCSLPRPAQLFVEWGAIPIYFGARLLHSRSLIANVKNYESSRGMYWRTDITDWLGGLPYECATVEEVFKFIRNDCGKFDLHNLKTTNSLANNWYLFKKGSRQWAVGSGQWAVGSGQ